MANDQTTVPSTKRGTFPPTYPKDQIYVAVSDLDTPGAGYDGGPGKGGIGGWPRGLVRQWTTEDRVPLAYRDPTTGTIVKGYLEAVESMAPGKDGKPTVTASVKLFAERNKNGQWVAVEPTPAAVKRATHGATSITQALMPAGALASMQATSARMAAAGLPG